MQPKRTTAKRRVWIGMAVVKIGVVAVVACSGGSPATPSNVDAGAAATSSALTYYADVKPIVDEKCTLCHYEGGIAPFTLLTYEDLTKYAAEIGPAVQSHTMPPWPPGAGCNTYRGDRTLTDAQIATITSWVSGGQAAGDPSTYRPLGDPPAPSLTRVDDALVMPEAYTPQQRPDDYRCFLLDWPETATKFITGFGAQPGQTAIVHHLLSYIVPADQIAAYQAFDDADPGPGYTCFGGPTGNLNANGTTPLVPIDSGVSDAGSASAVGLPQQVGGWVPGSVGSDFPAGTGIRIEAGSKIVLQVHYNTLSASPAPDQTKLEIEVADSVDKEAFILPFTDSAWPKSHTMNIPAGDPDAGYSYEVGAGLWTSTLTKGAVGGNAPFTIYSSLLHMHLHGTQASLTVDHDDGSSACLLHIPKWNFHWQGTYGLAEPMQIDPGDQIKISCQWDNSAANQPIINGAPMDVTDLNWGEGTTDEMCIGFIYVTR